MNMVAKYVVAVGVLLHELNQKFPNSKLLEPLYLNVSLPPVCNILSSVVSSGHG